MRSKRPPFETTREADACTSTPCDLAEHVCCRFNPQIIYRNRIKDLVGYNNVCVGFDSEPARTAMGPCFCLQSYFGLR